VLRNLLAKFTLFLIFTQQCDSTGFGLPMKSEDNWNELTMK